jgi:S-adenosylmethionine:tRNA ribosyltransferase-isomerase
VLDLKPTAAPALRPLPVELRASAPPEFRGLRRDHVRLMVIDRERGAITHTRFDRLGDFLSPGDLLAVNASRTIPAALPVTREDLTQVELRLCVRRRHRWDLLAVEPEPPHRNIEMRAGERLMLGTELFGTVLHRRPDIPLLWEIDVVDDSLVTFQRFGRPIRYSYVRRPVPIDYYQTVYASVPGSAEMPSAGRPLSWQLLRRLRAEGVALAPLVLTRASAPTRTTTSTSSTACSRSASRVPRRPRRRWARPAG